MIEIFTAAQIPLPTGNQLAIMVKFFCWEMVCVTIFDQLLQSIIFWLPLPKDRTLVGRLPIPNLDQLHLPSLSLIHLKILSVKSTDYDQLNLHIPYGSMCIHFPACVHDVSQ